MNHSHLELLDLEGMIKFEVLVVDKFVLDHFAILCLRLGMPCLPVTSDTRFLHCSRGSE